MERIAPHRLCGVLNLPATSLVHCCCDGLFGRTTEVRMQHVMALLSPNCHLNIHGEWCGVGFVLPAHKILKCHPWYPIGETLYNKTTSAVQTSPTDRVVVKHILGPKALCFLKQNLLLPTANGQFACAISISNEQN